MGPEILIVGDRSHRSELIPRVQDLGYVVTPVRERDLLSHVTRSPNPAAVIVCLGGADVRGLVRGVRASREGASTPVLLYGRLQGEIRDLADVLELGADRFLESPVDVEELAAALAELAGPPDVGPRPRTRAPATTVEERGDPVLDQLHRTLESLAARLETREEPADGDGGFDLEAMGLDSVPDVDPGFAGEVDLELLRETTQKLEPRATPRASEPAVQPRRHERTEPLAPANKRSPAQPPAQAQAQEHRPAPERRRPEPTQASERRPPERSERRLPDPAPVRQRDVDSPTLRLPRKGRWGRGESAEPVGEISRVEPDAPVRRGDPTVDRTAPVATAARDDVRKDRTGQSGPLTRRPWPEDHGGADRSSAAGSRAGRQVGPSDETARVPTPRGSREEPRPPVREDGRDHAERDAGRWGRLREAEAARAERGEDRARGARGAEGGDARGDGRWGRGRADAREAGRWGRGDEARASEGEGRERPPEGERWGRRAEARAPEGEGRERPPEGERWGRRAEARAPEGEGRERPSGGDGPGGREDARWGRARGSDGEGHDAREGQSGAPDGREVVRWGGAERVRAEVSQAGALEVARREAPGPGRAVQVERTARLRADDGRGAPARAVEERSALRVDEGRGASSHGRGSAGARPRDGEVPWGGEVLRRDAGASGREPSLAPLGEPWADGEGEGAALLAHLRRERFTGCLEVSPVGGPRRLWWSEGQVIGGASARATESMLGRLVARGLIDAEQRELAARWSSGDPRRDAERLAQAGWLKPQEAQEALREPVRRLVERIAEASTLAWALFPGERPAAPVELGVPLASLIAGGVRRAGRRDELRIAVPDALRPRLSFAGPEALAAELRWPAVADIAARFDGRASVGELVAAGIAEEAELRGLVHVLALLGHLAPPVEDEAAGLAALDRRRVRERLRLARETDYFGLLGLPRDATRDEVLAAHADLTATFGEALEPASRVELAEELAELQAALDEARDVLTDEALHSAYLAREGAE